MIGGKPAVFISCSEQFKARVAYTIRDALRAAGAEPVIVADLPRPGGAWSPEDKVEAYLNRSDAFVALLTPDDQVGETWRSRPNIADEIGRARNKPHLADHIVVFKEPRVSMHSNVNPAYEQLDLGDVPAAASRLIKQLKVWDFGLKEHAGAAPPPGQPIQRSVLFPMFDLNNFEATAKRIRVWMADHTKIQQQQEVERLFDEIRRSPDFDDRFTAANTLVPVARIDPTLVPTGVMDELSRHSDFSVRSAVAGILHDLAVTTPGMVPLDILKRFANPEEDWYVSAPAVVALQQVALSRPDAMDVLIDLAQSDDPDAREIALRAFQRLSAVRLEVIPTETILKLTADEKPAIRALARRLMAKFPPERNPNWRGGYYAFEL
jgi:hypothetical protein